MRISDWSSDVCSSDLVLSYENLLRRPQETLEGLRDFLGVPPEEAQIAAAVAELTPGRRAANFDKWKQPMSRRSDERRVGDEWVRTCRSRWSLSLLKKNK